MNTTRITLREANQQLSRFVREVEAGAEVVITRRGRPVARLVPISSERILNSEQEAALRRVEDRMRHGYRLGGQAPRREEIYDR
jgi:prevent-host-death family protein